MSVSLKGRHPPPLLLSIMLLGLSSSLHAGEMMPVFRISSMTYSEPVPIEGALNEWQSAFHGGERQWTSNWAEVGFQTGPLGVSAVSRYDVDLRFSRAAADLYYSIENKLPLDIGRNYDVEVNGNAFQAAGVRLSWSSAWHDRGLELVSGISFLQTRNLQDLRLSGYAIPFSSDDFDYSLNTGYHYHKDLLFARPSVEEPEGKGLAVDLRGQFLMSSRWRVDFEVRDLLSRIWWSDAPYTRATAATGTKTYDEDGYVKSVSPALRGREGYESHTQELPIAAAVELHAPLSQNLSSIALYRRHFGMDLWGLGAETYGNALVWGVDYWPVISALGVHVKWQRLTASLTLDGTDREEVRTAWLNFEYR